MIHNTDDIDLQALYGFRDNIGFSYGDPMGENEKGSVDYVSGEYDNRIQQLLGEDFVEMAADKQNFKGNDKENLKADCKENGVHTGGDAVIQISDDKENTKGQNEENLEGDDKENLVRKGSNADAVIQISDDKENLDGSNKENFQDHTNENIVIEILDDEEAREEEDNNDGGYGFYIKQRLAEEIENRKLELYKAAIIGDWKKAEEIFYSYPNDIRPTTRLNVLGETALHVATAANQIEFVAELVDLMDEEDLLIKTYGRQKVGRITSSTRNSELVEKGAEIDHEFACSEGNTALCYAAVSGNIQNASCMLEKVPDLSVIQGEEDIFPIRMAAWHGHHGMVHYLYKKSLQHHYLDENYCIDVLMAFIDCDLYDIAIQMVFEKPWLAAKANSKGFTALYAFARKSRITSNDLSSNTSFLTKYSPKRQKNFQKQGSDLLKLLLDLAMPVVEERSSMLIKKALFTAAEEGNFEFLNTALNLNPDLAFELDENYYTIFHVDIFNKVHEIESIQNVIRLTKDKEGNNILHLAGKLPLSGLQVVPGEALQLQRELQWFQKVKKLVGKHLTEAKNDKGKTPRELFADEHEDLRQKGAKWMKDTINSCLVVATLVAGVAFASAITVPGGTGDTTGIPNLLSQIWFKVFSILNALSLIFSASSILLFLTIFISHYSFGDFLKSLPTKFTLGLLLLSAAIQAMIVAFIASFLIMCRHQKIGLAFPVAAIAFVPVVVFLFRHFGLLFRYLCLVRAF